MILCFFLIFFVVVLLVGCVIVFVFEVCCDVVLDGLY